METDVAAAAANHQTLQRRVDALDEVLTNFTDTSSCTRRTISSRSSFWNGAQQQDDVGPTMEEICAKYAPITLQTQFEEVYRMLHPALLRTTGGQRRKNASVFLEGVRGSGKSLVLEQCLKAFQDEFFYTSTKPSSSPGDADGGDNSSKKQNYPHHTPAFRIVRLHGILVPGNNVNLVVHEILRQLTTLAQEESQEEDNSAADGDGQTTVDKSSDSAERPLKRTKQSAAAKELVGLKHASFTNQIQLLNEILQLACVDDIPVLFILDELDAFVVSDKSGSGTSTAETATKDHQLLLYHLLDRVTTGTSLVSLVGLTCYHGIVDLLEKRIKSRAEGTKFVHFGPLQTLEDLKDILVDKTTNTDLSAQVAAICSPPRQSGSAQSADSNHERVYQSLLRSQRLGYDVRWFCRVFFGAFSSYRLDCVCHLGSTQPHEQAQVPEFGSQYVLDALVSMGAAFLTSAAQCDPLVVINGVSPDSRMQALRDLDGPQVALLFSARRILARDNQRDSMQAPQLTLDRLLHEYKSTYRGTTNRYDATVLWNAFRALMEMGVLRPGMDHSGGPPFQYEQDAESSYGEMPPTILSRVALHLNVDIHRELKAALQKNNVFECSTALKEWGKKIN